MPSDFFKILDFNLENFVDAISNDECPPSFVKGMEKVKYLYDYLSHRGIASQKIIVENEYVDGDYLDDFSNYYVKCFYPYQRLCKRLHFFSERFSEEDFLSFILNAGNKENIKRFQDAYNGYIIARPLPQAIIGRTALVPYRFNKEVERYYTCVKDCKANLFGIDLKIKSLEFQEQDTVMSACSTVALWCCLHKTAELFHTPVPTPAMITWQASQIINVDRSVPTQGLILTQMNKAIVSNGLVAEIKELTPDLPLLPLLYGYLKAELPVILGVDIKDVGLHAITLVGYSLDKQEPKSPYVPDEGIPFIGNRISKLYAHDDQIGPFSRLERKYTRNKKRVITFTSSWKDPKDKLAIITPTVVIVPVYHKIRITYLDVHRWLVQFNLLPIEDKRLAKVLDPTNLGWDLYLTTTNLLKKYQLKHPHQDAEELKKILLISHPRYIWHAILWKGETRLLELFADSTDIPESFPFYYIVWHDPEVKKEILKALDNLESEEILNEILSPKFIEFLRFGPKKK